MNDEQMDTLLKDTPAIPAALASKIHSQIRQQAAPVTPLMSASAYTLIFLACFVILSEVYATFLKMNGLRVLPRTAALQLLLSLAIVACFASNTVARSMRPAGGRLHSWLLSAKALVVYEALVLFFFKDHSTANFVHNGMNCLSLGLLGGLFLAVPCWLLIRRGLILEPVQAAAAVGLVSGLGGLAALTLHCPLLAASHAAVWHAAIVVIWVGVGALAGFLTSVMRARS